MIRPPFIINLIVSVGLLVGCIYFWGFCDNSGKFVAAAFLLIGLAQYGTNLMDFLDARKCK